MKTDSIPNDTTKTTSLIEMSDNHSSVNFFDFCTGNSTASNNIFRCQNNWYTLSSVGPLPSDVSKRRKVLKRRMVLAGIIAAILVIASVVIGVVVVKNKSAAAAAAAASSGNNSESSSTASPSTSASAAASSVPFSSSSSSSSSSSPNANTPSSHSSPSSSSTTSNSSQPQPQITFFTIQSQELGLGSNPFVLEVSGSSTSQNAAATMNYYSGGKNQQWHWNGNQLVNANSGLCLTTSQASGGDSCSMTLIQSFCSSAASQTWSFSGGSLGNSGQINSQFISPPSASTPNSAQCLHVGGGSTVAGTQVWSCGCQASSTETWTLVKV